VIAWSVRRKFLVAGAVFLPALYAIWFRMKPLPAENLDATGASSSIVRRIGASARFYAKPIGDSALARRDRGAGPALLTPRCSLAGLRHLPSRAAD
jgi:hypothetical protein